MLLHCACGGLPRPSSVGLRRWSNPTREAQEAVCEMNFINGSKALNLCNSRRTTRQDWPYMQDTARIGSVYNKWILTILNIQLS